MPRQNRVTPYGDLIATEARGTLMGNRGCIHSDDERVVRRWQVRRWIACALSFRGRWRYVMPPGRWTALFFLDEATALAAGHRPCAECRWADYRRFQDAFLAAHPGHPVGADAMDRTLHEARVGEGRRKRTYAAPAGSLPEGAFVEVDGRPWLVRGPELLAWTPSGYAGRRPRPAGEVTVLTPAPAVAAIRARYAPGVHPSAGAGAAR
ncbi:MAG: hypothetical protein E6J41_13020 [Chloroflexi bacterium]|nr:MAG: hypothetical protein E6J41_13020 [Chloroflexota bacterium]